MLRAAIAFFVLGILAYFLGANDIGGLSIELGRMFLLVFFILALISFVVNLVTGRRQKILV